jgi:hypothetical protein
MRAINLMMKCYERMIRSCKKIQKKLEIMEDYGAVLESYGKKDKLI